MSILPGFENFAGRSDDIIETPERVAKEIIQFFRPTGKILDPCCGRGVFLEQMIGAEWCEILQGRDFFEWNQKVDWIVSNPPYSIFSAFMRHSMRIADNIVYLIPINKIFSSHRLISDIRKWGWIQTIYYFGDRISSSWPLHGYCIGAVYFKKGYRGSIEMIFKNVPRSDSMG